MENVKYPIELEVITPLSVGAGNDNEWTRGIDFVQKDGKVYVLDIQKAVANGVDVDRLSALFLKYDEKGICLLLGGQLEQVSKYVFHSPASTTNPIKAFLRTQLFDKPIVAGSSLKGAVRSALFKYLRTSEKTNEEVFGNMKDGTDLMRFIQIGDIEMPSTQLVNTKIFNLYKEGQNWYGGWKHKGTDKDGNSHTDNHFNPVGFNTLYECVVPGQKGVGSVTLARSAYKNMVKNTVAAIPCREKKEELMMKDLSHLFQVINSVTKVYLLKEKAFFEKYPAERSDKVVDNIDYLLSLIPDDGSSCLLKMSAGVGFHSITGDWQFDDYDKTKFWEYGRDAGKKKYKSRKTAEYRGHLQLMGFVRLRPLSAAEAQEAEQQQANQHNQLIEDMMLPVRQREAEKAHKAEEERQRQLAVQKEKQKQDCYRKHIEMARQYQDEEKWNEAIAELKEAAFLYPDDREYKELMEKCENGKKNAAFRQEEAESAQQKLRQPLAEFIQKVSSAGNLVGSTVKWLKAEGNKFGASEHNAFINAARQLPAREQKRLKEKFRDLVRQAGQDAVDLLKKELGIV